jgi:hypothetical protein
VYRHHYSFSQKLGLSSFLTQLHYTFHFSNVNNMLYYLCFPLTLLVIVPIEAIKRIITMTWTSIANITKRLGSPCAAEDAVVAIRRTRDGKIKVTLAAGWRHVLPKTLDDDPAFLMVWNDDNILATVNAFNQALLNPNNGPAPPEWLHVGAGVGHQITVPGLKTLILAYVQLRAASGGVVGKCMIAPNSVSQYCRVCSAFCGVGMEPFFIAHAVCPIGRNYILADYRKRTTAEADPILAPPAHIGVAVFA